MTGDLLSDLTLITNFLCMAISLWFAIYLLARSPANPLTFRAVVALIALAFYYNSAFHDVIDSNSDTGSVRSLTTLIALIAAHDLTHYLLPAQQRKRLYLAARVVVLLGVVAMVLLFTAPRTAECDPRYTCPSNIIYPWYIIDSFKVLFFFAILYNLWLIKKSAVPLDNIAFYVSLLFGTSTIAYSLVGTILNVDLPRFIPSTAMLVALSLLLYSVAHNQSFVARRRFQYDLLITLLTITVIVAIYVISAWQIGLGPSGILLLAVLAIFTHSAYDFVREFLDHMFRTQEGRIRQELRQMARDTSSEEALPRFMKRGLAILCHNLRASYGLIALHQDGQYQVVASLHSLPVGTQLSTPEIPPDVTGGMYTNLMGYKLWLVPAFVGSEQVAVVGVGSRKDLVPFTEEDLYWIEDIAEEIGWMASLYLKGRTGIAATSVDSLVKVVNPLQAPFDDFEADELFSKLAYKLDPELVKSVEEGLRNLKDYSKLGKSPLVSILAVQAKDHLECGKQVQVKLNSIIEKLRPMGDLPAEPLPREWYAYTILHDAYVENRMAREIMSKLYISEGTYYRLRRHALRGITRAMLEMDAIA
jgi:hypothetical protein